MAHTIPTSTQTMATPSPCSSWSSTTNNPASHNYSSGSPWLLWCSVLSTLTGACTELPIVPTNSMPKYQLLGFYSRLHALVSGFINTTLSPLSFLQVIARGYEWRLHAPATLSAVMHSCDLIPSKFWVTFLCWMLCAHHLACGKWAANHCNPWRVDRSIPTALVSVLFDNHKAASG